MTQLIYRGETIAYTLRPAKSHRKPYALNWRYQVAGATYDEPIPVVVYRKPQAINWRWSIKEI